MSGEGKTSETAANKPQRDEKGRLLPGSNANPGGRPKLPDWYKSNAPSALAVTLAVATGIVIDAPEIPEETRALCRELAADSKVSERLLAASKIKDDVYGMAKEHVQVSSEHREIKAVEVRIVRAEIKAPEVVEAKMIGKSDAE